MTYSPHGSHTRDEKGDMIQASRMIIEENRFFHGQFLEKEWKTRALVCQIWDYYPKRKPELILGMEVIIVDEKQQKDYRDDMI
ncbi:unnamed protein product [Microthlaspi erraticum]|uniref:DUF223 domain-containing protein n=1 Tax=Microthlaspi erraticum TaxID=1685480 RepID=A0A6D2KJL1_9BRAS|nr:unnamed protein product [Microthlaspi erraticum]